MFYVEQMSTEEVKAVQLSILVDVASFCQENGIRYFLAGGTLLGAIRHKGFIPWDDDIDILMPRPDYERFLRSFNNNTRKTAPLKVSAYEIDSSYIYPFAKVCNTNTHLEEHTLYSYPLGVHIDVFPIDGLPDDVRDSNRLFGKVKFLKHLYGLKVMKPRRGRSFHKEIIRAVGQLFLYLVSTKQLVANITELSKTYCYETSNHAGCVAWGYGKRERLKKAVFAEAIDVIFEGHTFRAPVGYDEYLVALYGDYMQLPPVEKRQSHHMFRAYWKY